MSRKIVKEDEPRDIDGEKRAPDSAYENARTNFPEQSDFDSAVDMVWSLGPHPWYQHYTTLASLVDKLSGQWWFARSDNGEMNDRQESIKFGNKQLSAKTYQASFVHGAAENVALWSLYAPSDPFAIRITLPGDALQKWVEELKGDCLHFRDSPKARKVIRSEFKDIIYAAVAFRYGDRRKDGCKISRDKSRRNILYWAEVNSKRIPNLEERICDDRCTGWMKDYEWRHERESRICLRVKDVGGPKALWCNVPSWLVEKMRFTFSPWLPVECEDEVKRVIVNALRRTESERGEQAKQYSDRFKRSVVQGAIYLKHSKLVCAFKDGKEATQICPLFKTDKK